MLASEIGRKALFLRNHGDGNFPQFKIERVFEA
jgi:hypothetical protein